jgi:hypothetical protein
MCLRRLFWTRQTSTGTYNAPAPSPGGRLPLVPWADLAFRRHLGKGAFGDVALMAWARRGLTVAVKCNGTDSVDGAAIDNERRLYELLKDNPHENIECTPSARTPPTARCGW